ncbi:MAG: hypothetical protein HQ510_10110 [Candidatus Marinimicrobia bacterium]|nr:hypothetical protein [Candidatus Neomarinimicrobiota bacterium]
MKLNLVFKLKGFVLPAAIIFGLVGFSIVISFFSWTINRRYALNLRIAKIKAHYNAETGLAERAFSIMTRSDFTVVDTTLVQDGIWIDNQDPQFSQGLYKNVLIKHEIDTSTSIVQLKGIAHGIAFVKNRFGKIVSVEDSARMTLGEESLAKYMYLTKDEKAGGAPFTFDGPGDRRHVTFGDNDILSGGNIQTNEFMTMSHWGCPEFLGTVYITIDTLSGEPQEPVMDDCEIDDVFLGEPQFKYTPPLKLPPEGYELAKNAANYIFDSNELFKHDFVHRDTLIMTDIEFLPNGGFRVKRWWFLKPPHLNDQAVLPGGGGEYPNPTPSMMDGVIDLCTDCCPYPSCCGSNPPSSDDLRACNPYREAMENYHAIDVDSLTLQETYMNPTILGQHGFAHYDYPLTANNIITNEIRTPSGPTVIYVMGGPVRVHGIYNGRFTVVTDEYTTYHRHASNNYNPVIDTLWCNIWITDDLRNADASLGLMAPPQPDDKCEGGSDNRMGLVSGANVIVANTDANGAKNSQNQTGGVDVVIHAAICAFKESFTVQYWQNTTNVPTMGHMTYQPPHGDNLGPSIFGFSNPVARDERGTIYLWGGLIQLYRGYIIRNPDSPYGLAWIGYQKDYHFDENNVCSPPPFFPTVEYVNGEKAMYMVDYGL